MPRLYGWRPYHQSAQASHPSALTNNFKGKVDLRIREKAGSAHARHAFYAIAAVMWVSPICMCLPIQEWQPAVTSAVVLSRRHIWQRQRQTCNFHMQQRKAYISAPHSFRLTQGPSLHA